ncbi:MAG: hypothetical protein WCR95_02515 [Eubacteriales bacterium]
MKKEFIERIIVTFFEGVFTYIFANMSDIQAIFTNGAVIKPILTALVYGAIAFGLSTVYNGILKPFLAKKSSAPGNTSKL